MKQEKYNTSKITILDTYVYKTNIQRVVLTPLVLICLSTLIFLILFSQLVSWNSNFLCKYKFFNQEFLNTFICKSKWKFSTPLLTKRRFEKRLTTYFYDPLALETWGRDNEEETFNSKLFKVTIICF